MANSMVNNEWPKSRICAHFFTKKSCGRIICSIFFGCFNGAYHCL